MDCIVPLITILLIITNVSVYMLRPEQIHLSLDSSSRDMVVMWSTYSGQPCSLTFYSHDTNSTTIVYSSLVKLERDSWNAVPYIHRAVMKNLTGGCIYKYKIKCTRGKQSGESPLLSFKTKGANVQTTSFIVYADVDSTAFQTFKAIADEVSATDYDAVLHVGDIAYNLHDNGGKVGDEFMQNIQDISAKVPYLTTPGDHEKHDNFYHYRTRFSSPGMSWPMSQDHLWFSVDIGLVHLISYSTEVYFTPHLDECEQYKWLLNDLTEANKNRQQQPWIIAMGHRPMYCTGLNIDDCADGPLQGWVKQGLEKLFYSFGVDLIIQGHEHIYERSWPLCDGKPRGDNYSNPAAPVHIISGSAGGIKYIHGSTHQEPWAAFQFVPAVEGMYGQLHVVNTTHLFWNAVNVHDNSTIDSMWIIQENHRQFAKETDCEKRHHLGPSVCVCPSALAISYTLIAIFSSISLSLFSLCVIYLRFRCIHNMRKPIYKTVAAVEPESEELILDNDL